MDRGAEQKALALAHRLCERQSKTGSWNAFVLRPGGSNQWTTAVSLCALGQLKKKLSAKPPRWIERGLKRGWQFMADQQSLGSAIGFNAETPHDADSTIWLCRSLITLGNHQTIESFDKQKKITREDWLEKGLEYVIKHLTEDERMVCTYTCEDGILEYVGRPNHLGSSWLGPHHCVSANAVALARELEEFCPNVKVESSKKLAKLDLSGRPFWWPNKDMSTFLLGEASINRLEAIEAHWVLRVPDHADKTGEHSTYSQDRDTEGAICKDNGSFGLAISIINIASQSKE